MTETSIKVLAVEDQPFQAEVLRDKLHSGGYEVLGPFKSGETALKALKEGDLHPDVAVLDIEVDGALDGIETAKRLYQIYDCGIIFLSHLQDESTRARIGDVPAIFHSKTDNLINNIALYDAVDRLSTRAVKKPSISNKKPIHLGEELLSLSNRQKVIVVDASQIIWVEADHEIAYVMIKQDDGTVEKHLAKGTLKQVETTLTTHYGHFVRISKQCLVNLKMISSINKSYTDEDGKKREVVEFKDDYKPLTIGRRYKAGLKSYFKEI